MSVNNSVGEEQFVVLQLAGQDYGIEISGVNKIIHMEEITKIPQAADFVEGIISLRGDVIPIIDLGKRFNIFGTERNEKSRIIIVEVGEILIGVLVDAVVEVLRIPKEKIGPAPQMSAAIDTNFMQGIALIEDRLIILLDIDQILYEGEKDVLKMLEQDLEPTS